MEAVKESIETIENDAHNVREVFVSHSYTAGDAAVGSIARMAPPFVPEDEESGYAGSLVMFPRSRIWRRYAKIINPKLPGPRRRMRAVLDMAHRPKPTGSFLTDFGVLDSRIAMYDEFEKPYDNVPRTGDKARNIVSDSVIEEEVTKKVLGWNPIVNAPSGRWIGVYPGVESARYWWDLHKRTVCRTTGAWLDGSLHDMLNKNGMTPACRFSAAARPDDEAMSILPNGVMSEADSIFKHTPMYPWLGTCGNAGLRLSHFIRQLRAAYAMAAYYPNTPLVEVSAQDMLAWAREVEFTFSPYPAKPGWTGDTTQAPYNYVGSYQEWRNMPLFYRSNSPVGPDGGRTHGWALLALALSKWNGNDEHDYTAEHFLAWVERSLLPSGFIQAVRYDETGGPTPQECGVQSHELSAAEIEAPIFAYGVVALAYRMYGADDMPTWVRTMLDKLCGIYMRFWPAGAASPAWKKYWIVKTHSQWLSADQVRPCPDKSSTVNGWALLECGLRFGSPATQAAIRARKAEILDLWAKDHIIRPWAAGLVGQLS